MYKVVFGVIVVVAFTIIGFKLLYDSNGKIRRTITATDLKADLDKGRDVVVINVLSEDDYKNCHIEGSISIPLVSFSRNAFEQFQGKGKLVVYCASNTCRASHDAYDDLIAFGFTNVYVYEGGMKEWQQLGYPTQKL